LTHGLKQGVLRPQPSDCSSLTSAFRRVVSKTPLSIITNATSCSILRHGGPSMLLACCVRYHTTLSPVFLLPVEFDGLVSLRAMSCRSVCASRLTWMETQESHRAFARFVWMYECPLWLGRCQLTASYHCQDRCFTFTHAGQHVLLHIFATETLSVGPPGTCTVQFELRGPMPCFTRIFCPITVKSRNS
jgi:hypothetical protein